MKLDAPKNNNYCAQIVRVYAITELEGLDNLVGIPTLGYQALTTRDVQDGELRIAFTAETALSGEYAGKNNLFREAELNDDQAETGYLEKNGRIRAIKLRGHRSDALLMPLSSLDFAGFDWSELKEGDTFDTIEGHEICRKYEIPVKQFQGNAKSKIEKAFKRVTDKQFPMHLDTDNYFRSKHLLKSGQEVVVTQKLHGTSWRGGRVPVLRQLKWYEKLLKRFGVNIPEWEYDAVFGSRKVIKDINNPRQQHFYSSDIWTDYGQQVAELIPEGYLVYGELIGWTGEGSPLQKGYTYHLPQGEVELYVYRVAHVNRSGNLADLSWDGVKHFCRERGLKWVPELTRGIHGHPDNTEATDTFVNMVMDWHFAAEAPLDFDWNDNPLPLSDRKTVDEGICIRQEGLVPLILKAKSPVFLQHETKLLDKGELDVESAA